MLLWIERWGKKESRVMFFGEDTGRESAYLVEKLRECFVIRDYHGTVIILEAPMNDTATSPLPQSAYP